MALLRRLFNHRRYLHLVERSEQLIAMVLGLLMLLVTVVAVGELVIGLLGDLQAGRGNWLGDPLISVLGDLLNVLIALEVLQNVTSYLRRRAVQIELVLITAITALARKVIVLPSGMENKPQLLIGLGVAVLAFAAAYWLVRSSEPLKGKARTGPARSFPGRDPLPPPDADDGRRSEAHRPD